MLFPGRIILAIFAAAVAMGFALGILQWDTSKAKCIVTRNWSVGDWHTVFAVGKLQIRAHDFGCSPGNLIDPSQYQQ